MFTASLTASSRHYLSISHLSAAALFAKQCHDIELSAGTAPTDVERRQHGAYAVSSVIVAAAFLEATINELFTDCTDGLRAKWNALPAKSIMGRLWEMGIPRTASFPIIEKYQVALELNGIRAIEKGANPYQDTELLVKLRNALIHFEPETIVTYSGHEVPEPHNFEKRFASKKFDLNPFFGPGNAFYPERLLGSGCARWAVETAVAFTDEFFQRLNVPAVYESVRGTWNL